MIVQKMKKLRYCEKATKFEKYYTGFDVYSRTELVKILKLYSHSLSAGLVDFYITLNYSLTIG